MQEEGKLITCIGLGAISARNGIIENVPAWPTESMFCWTQTLSGIVLCANMTGKYEV